MFTNVTVFFNYNKSFLLEEYLNIFILLNFAVFLSSLFLILSYLLSVQNPDTEKLSSYECGFEPYEDSRNKFDVKFYIIAILFIVFDIEAIFIFPWSVVLGSLDIIGYWSMIDFIFELGLGFLYVWYMGALEWD